MKIVRLSVTRLRGIAHSPHIDNSGASAGRGALPDSAPLTSKPSAQKAYPSVIPQQANPCIKRKNVGTHN
jgi:hypothetical protein